MIEINDFGGAELQQINQTKINVKNTKTFLYIFNINWITFYITMLD